MLTLSTQQACGKGCLKCNTDDQCQIPDITKLYKLNDVTAEKVTKDGCILIDFEGICVACQPGRYLDTATDSCIVPEGIENCEMYSNATTCTVCKTGFYLDAGAATCTAVDPKITNCVYYSSATECLSCEDNFLLGYDLKECVPNPGEDNCVSYSFVSCTSCKSNLVRTLNGYLEGWRSVDGSSVKTAVALLAGGTFTGLSSQTACETALASNCAAFETGLNKCITCVPGFFITESSLCVAYPDEKLANCQEYSSATTCTKCISAHYFVQGVCTKIAEDDLKKFCVEYNTASSSVQCSKCSDNYYLSNNSCTERDKSKDSKIANCDVKDPTGDKCFSCSNNMIISSDGLECMSPIANCASYNSPSSGQSLDCNTCESGFFKKTNVVTPGSDLPPTECIAGEVENCDTYSSSTTTCQICKNGYILQGTTCIANNPIAGCTVFSSTDLEECSTCTNTSNFNFVINKRCNAIVNQVANCAAHNGGTVTAPECETCNKYYQLDGTSKCTKIDIANCINWANSDCDQCEAGYAVSADGKECMRPLAYLTDQCAEDTTVGDNGHKVREVSCTKCKEHSYPIDFNKHFICVENSNLKEFNTGNAVTQIDNCLKYDKDFKCFQCNPTETNKFLKGDQTECLATCHATTPVYSKVVLEIEDIGGTKYYQVSQFNMCESDQTDATHAGCHIIAPNSDVLGTPICIGCRPAIGAAKAYFPVVDNIKIENYSMVDPNSTSYPYMPSPHARFTKVTCLQFASTDANKIDNKDSSTISPTACEYYLTDTTVKNVCLRCNFGQTSTIAASGHLDDCKADSNFDSQTRYYNIDLKWELFFSVHKCVGNGIPVVGVNSTVTTSTPPVSDSNPEGFTKWNDNNSTASKFANSAGTQKNIVCADYEGGMFNISDTTDKVANCALAVLYVGTDGTNNYTSKKYGNVCAACKPGYKAEVYTGNDDSNKFIIEKCTKIDNCKAGGNLVDTCQECETNYVLLYDKVIKYDSTVECVPVPTSDQAKYEHCLAGSKNTDNNLDKCEVCKKGYHLNLDNHCESINSAKCKAGNFRVKETKGFIADAVDYMMYYQAQGIGCNECDASHSAVQLVVSNKLCVKSSWIQTKVDSIAADKTKYIPFCKLYKASELTDPRCSECDANYVIHGTSSGVTGEKCYPATSLQNCVVAKSADECIKCVNNTFGLALGSCTPGNIANCLEYNYDTLENQVKCITCSPGFYLSVNDNTCLQGQIPKCKRFENNQKNRCEICEDGHALASISDNEVYCYPVSSDLACSEYNINTHTKGAAINCTACTNKTSHLVVSPAATTEDRTICMDFVPVANCEAYGVGTTLSNSTFKCTKCTKAFYYDSSSNACVARVNVPAKCATYDTNKDECTECTQDSYLFNSKKECRDYPKGILGCQEYSDAVTCTKCQPERYLSENACPKADPIIPDCLYYNSKTTCESCKSGFVLLNNECTKAEATNCVEYTSKTACKTCSALFGLETNSNSVTNCVNKSKNGCDIVSDNSPYNCTQCSNGFYLKEGNCENPTSIENCLQYESADTCKACKEGFALATNKKSCINTGVIGGLIPAGCSEANVVATPVCSRCGPAYHFLQDSCAKQCTGDDADGCLTCDKTDPTKCLVCVSNYHQNKDGKCVKDVTTKPEPPTGGSSGIFGCMVAFLVSLTVLIR